MSILTFFRQRWDRRAALSDPVVNADEPQPFVKAEPLPHQQDSEPPHEEKSGAFLRREPIDEPEPRLHTDPLQNTNTQLPMTQTQPAPIPDRKRESAIPDLPMGSTLDTAIARFTDIVKKRLAGDSVQDQQQLDFPKTVLSETDSPFARFLIKYKLNYDEIILLMTALLPHIQPHLFDKLIQEEVPNVGDFPEVGGMRGQNFRGFLPTGETVQFLLADNDMAKRMATYSLFGPKHIFHKKRILWIEQPPTGEPLMSGKLVMSPEYVELFLLGKKSKPQFGTSFPAERIKTKLKWDDLVLDEGVNQQLDEIKRWLSHGAKLREDDVMKKRLRPGFRVLFHGPPGTGKTLTASLLGELAERPVYKIDLSAVVSKFIGETEKNLASLFARAENKKWILFFDEADALFGKRTNVRDAHDKYANQEVSYLLQRIENYNGLVILASNMKTNIDDAFIRRFDSIVQFSIPSEQERLEIWKKSFPGSIPFEDNEDIPALAARYALSGGNIINAIHYVCLKTLSDSTNMISSKAILESIQREYHKEGKVFQKR